MRIQIRGKTYTSPDVSDMDLITISAILGQEKVPDSGTPAYQDWLEKVTTRMRDPILQASAAFALTSLFENLPEEIVHYRLYRQNNGEYRVEHRFKLNTSEYIELCEQLSQIFLERGLPSEEKETAQKKRGKRNSKVNPVEVEV